MFFSEENGLFKAQPRPCVRPLFTGGYDGVHTAFSSLENVLHLSRDFGINILPYDTCTYTRIIHDYGTGGIKIAA